MASHQRLWPVLALILALLTFSVAQEAGLQNCQGQCITDMVQQANFLGCSAGDTLCLCNANGFLPGVYDCANKACPAGTDNSSLISYESKVCAAATSASRASQSASPSGGFSVTLIPSLSTSTTATSSSPLTTASLTGGATVTIFTAAPPPAAQTSSSSTGASTSSSNSGLSTGAKAGIGVGVSLGALLIVGLFAFFCFRQRRKKPMRVDSYHVRASPEYTREEIHGGGGFGSQGAFPDMAQHPEPEHAVYAVPPLPEKSMARARGVSGSSYGGGNGEVAGLGRQPSEKDRERYASERYSWSTEQKSEGNGNGNGYGNEYGNGNGNSNGYSNGYGAKHWDGGENVNRDGNGNGLGMRPVSPVSPVAGGGASMSEISRSPTIGGPEYKMLNAGRRPSYSTD